MEYPKQHKQIVTDLIDGKFILSKDGNYDVIKNHESFYLTFFSKSFGFELKIYQDFIFIVSDETNENTSRDISIFFSILCYELDRDSRNFIDELEYSEFSKEEIDKYFNNSSWSEIIQTNNQLKDPERRRNFLNLLERRNIIEKINEDKFYFTSAYKLFTEFAKE